MDEVEVQVLQLQVLQGLQEGRLHVLRVMSSVPQLGRDEHILSSQGLMRSCQIEFSRKWYRDFTTQTKYLSDPRETFSLEL